MCMVRSKTEGLTDRLIILTPGFDCRWGSYSRINALSPHGLCTGHELRPQTFPRCAWAVPGEVPRPPLLSLSHDA